MAKIRPFQAVHYNPTKIKDFKKVVCPPYDIISEEDQQRYHNLSPYNFTHIYLGKDKPTDDNSDNKYIRAKKFFDQWLEKKIMVQDEAPALYFYKIDYKIRGQKYSRLGFISLLELEDEGNSKIKPHENTHAKAVEDRYRLWTALNASLSCIFVCFSDKERTVEKIFNKYVLPTKPIVDVTDDDKVRHILWRFHDPALINEIGDSIDEQNLFIADGHHRYRVALDIHRARMAKKNTVSNNDPSNYVMTYFTNMDSRDLQIFPIHRIIKNFPHRLDFLEEFFRIDKIKNKDDLLVLLARAGNNEHALGLYTAEGAKLLRLKNKLLIDEYVKEGSKEYRNLDATILKYFILDKVGVKSEDIIYSKDLDEALAMVSKQQADASFILNPVKIAELKAIALHGEKMPPKTTYFYPKVLSGLTVYKME